MLGGLLAGWTLDAGGANWMLAGCILCGCVGTVLCLLALPRKGPECLLKILQNHSSQIRLNGV